MKKIYFLLVSLCSFSSCGEFENSLDKKQYKSIVGKYGDVYTTIGGKLIEYKAVKIEYSDSDASTLLISDSDSNFVYIQGPAVIHFNDNDFSTKSALRNALKSFKKQIK